MLVLESQFTKLLMSENIIPILYVIEEGCKQLLEMVIMGESITWDIFHNHMGHIPTPPQKIKKSILVLHFTIFILVDNFVKIAHNFPFVTIPIYKKGIIDMRK